MIIDKNEVEIKNGDFVRSESGAVYVVQKDTAGRTILFKLASDFPAIILDKACMNNFATGLEVIYNKKS